MTRQTRTSRSLDTRLDALETTATESESGIEVVWRDDRTGEFYDSDGERVESDPDALTIVVNETVVADREQAEAEGYDILGPAEDAPQDDVVRVAADSITEESI